MNLGQTIPTSIMKALFIFFHIYTELSLPLCICQWLQQFLLGKLDNILIAAKLKYGNCTAETCAMILYSEYISVRISLEKNHKPTTKQVQEGQKSSNLLINVTFLEQTQRLSSFNFYICQSFCNFLKQFIAEKCTVHASFFRGKNHTDDVEVLKTHKCIKHNALGITGLYTVGTTLALV